jgi:epothilone polyketide synthase E
MKDGSRTQVGEPDAQVSAVKKALIAVREMKQKLDAVERARTEPIAVIGIGCRFPGGADGPEAFWELLAEGRDAVADLPRDRWDIDDLYDPDPAAPGKITSRRAACIGEVDRFDPDFFGISPRETRNLDPQQRLSLEVAWEAIEDAGIVAQALAGTRTGVFMGVMHHDYAFLLSEHLASIDAYASSGTHYSAIANRISFTFDLKGPSIALDTACSSSLATVHTAVQSLRRRECDSALAGGVNLIISPMQSIAYSKWGMLSPDGRCYTFDARANGFVRGEGCGVVVLKRLSDAIAGGDRIRAIVRGTAVSQDGKTIVMTAPNGLAQQQAIREALADGGVDPALVTYVEAHGTGTPLGDPIEVEALAAVYGKAARYPCVLGALKTNMGHLEGAAGIAGFIKAVLCLEHGIIPPNLNFATANPHLPLQGSRLALATDLRVWEVPGQPRFAGVSSFGAGGTNLHAVLEQAPAARPLSGAPERSAELMVLSAKSAAALDAQAKRLRDHLDAHPTQGLHDVAFSLATTRSPMDHRLAMVATSREALRAALASAAEGQTPPGAVRGRVSTGGASKVVLVFPGQGSQWLGMGRQLSSEEPVFRAALEACDRAIEAEAGFSLLSELAASELTSQLGRIDVVQPVLFAMEVALAALWRSWGVEPDAVVGHSMGEVAAAHVAGALSLEDAVAIICRRSRLLRRISGQGEMAVVELSFSEAGAALAGYEDRLSVAVSNSPRSTVISGEPPALSEVLASLEAKGVFCRWVKVDVASHSPQVDPLRGDLVAALAGIQPKAAAVPMRSTVTGSVVTGPELGAGYWADNLRQPVRFAQTIRALREEGHGLFVEMSPHPILMTSMEEICEALERSGVVVGSLRRGQDERPAMLEALGALWARGYPVAWERLFPAGGRRVPLPTYPWQRERYWREVPERADEKGKGGIVLPSSEEDVDTLARRLEQTSALSGPEITGFRRGLLALAAAERKAEADVAVRDWLYEPTWRAQPSVGVPRPVKDGERWLILADAGGMGRALARELIARGASCLLAEAGDEREARPDGSWQVCPTRREDLEALRSAASLGGAPVGVVSFWGLDAPETSALTTEGLMESQRRLCGGAVQLLQALIRPAGAIEAEPPQLFFVTRGATSAAGAAINVAQAPLWGLAKVAALEHPELRVRQLDLDPTGASELGDALLSELLSSTLESQVAWRGRERHVRRLVRLRLPEAPSTPVLRADACYLITGGLGNLGLTLAASLVEQGARHLVLTSRRGAAGPEARRAVEALEQLGAQVLVSQADVANPEQMSEVFAAIEAGGVPLRGVFHTAGISSSSPLAIEETDSLLATLRPKVAGAWLLHTLSAAHPLDYFVCYSSVSALWGVAGGGSYVAANTFLDTLAEARAQAGRVAQSMNFGLVPGGMATEEIARSAQQQGILPMPVSHVNAGLQLVLSSGRSRIALTQMSWPRFRALYEARGPQPLLDELALDTLEALLAAEEGSLFQQLSRAPEDARDALVIDTLRGVVSRILRLAPDRIERQHPLTAYGLDSLTSVEIRNALRSTGVTVGGARLLKGASLQDLAGEIRSDFESGAWRDDPRPRVSSDVAVVASHARRPGQDAPATHPAMEPSSRSPDAQAIAANGWLLIPTPRPEARIRLFCFPYAGGGPGIFQRWAAQLPSEVEVCAVSLPGRAHRLGESPLGRMDDLVEELVPSLEPRLDRPFALFGHCLGGVQMYEVASAIRARSGRLPIHLFISGSRAPSSYTPEQLQLDALQFDLGAPAPGQPLSDTKLLDMVADLNFPSSSVLFDDPETRELVMPVLRADMEMNRTYCFDPSRPERRLPVPATVMGGRADPFVTRPHLEKWKELATGTFEILMRPGDHYFIHREEQHWLRIVRESLLRGIGA